MKEATEPVPGVVLIRDVTDHKSRVQKGAEYGGLKPLLSSISWSMSFCKYSVFLLTA